jgi:hypothetical protein
LLGAILRTRDRIDRAFSDAPKVPARLKAMEAHSAEMA